MSAETLDRVPTYPKDGDSVMQGEKYLLWRLRLNGSAAIGAQILGIKEYIRQTIIADHGETRLMGKGPNGKMETVGELFERVYRVPLIPKAKKKA